jgi:AcrR family transcriptional regulator
MTIPLPTSADSDTAVAGCDRVPSSDWGGLDQGQKRERLLKVANDVFSAQGLDAPMSDVAAAAGAGVASVYRVFDSKHQLLAALLVRRNEQVAAAVAEALRRPGDRWTALVDMITDLVEGQSTDDLIGEARVVVGDHPGVLAARARTAQAIEQLLAGARAEGRLRADATALDLRLLFTATRAARRIEADAWRRTLRLMIDALDTRRSGPGDR